MKMLSAKPAVAPVSQPHPTFPPFHHIPGVSNFRDIGGWPITSPTSSPKYVRKGLIFRGGDTTHITSAGISKLQDLDVKTDCDLRSAQQIKKAGGFKDMGEWGIARIFSPVFGDEEYTEEKARARYECYASEDTADIVQAFVEILTSGAPAMVTVLRHLLSTASTTPPPAFFMHCTTGNNRTGIFISLLLLLLDVPQNFIIREYTLSNAGLAPTKHINVERLLKKGAFQDYGEIEARRKCERMVGAREESMAALLAEVESRWGGAEGYFGGVVGLASEEIRSVRQILTADGEAGLSLET
ncbi:hypothetical protein CC86DRAFT_89273 [Ophiobolus disseminans]|uniref:Tyrosine specific protein phosphatases domain-containing protein n=1 Tax=Ophiobolus disseminans TaxID=1469910 RepID=A0A6A7AGI8_9PLEO|nr:hypothetical protein CC86DRAFT_89273 [Ophiobolus disseminans]